MTPGLEFGLYCLTGGVVGLAIAKFDIWRMNRRPDPFLCQKCGNDRVYLTHIGETVGDVMCHRKYWYTCYCCEDLTERKAPIKAVKDQAAQRISGYALLCVGSLIAAGIVDLALHKPVANYQKQGFTFLMIFLGYTAVTFLQVLYPKVKRRVYGSKRRYSPTKRHVSDDRPGWDD